MRIPRKRLRGMDITMPRDQSKAPAGHVMMNVRIKRWHMPVLIFKGLRKSGIPSRYWPLFFWRYYITKRWRPANVR